MTQETNGQTSSDVVANAPIGMAGQVRRAVPTHTRAGEETAIRIVDGEEGSDVVWNGQDPTPHPELDTFDRMPEPRSFVTTPRVPEGTDALGKMKAEVEDRLRTTFERPLEVTNPTNRKKISLKTETQYRTRAKTLRTRFLSNYEDHAEADVVQFAHWFLSLRTDYKPSAWRFMRQIALYAVSLFVDPDSDLARQAISVIESDAPQDGHMSTAKAKDPKRKLATSANKQKYVDHDELNRLIAHFKVKSRSGQSAANCMDILHACILTGLRPVEWATTSMGRIPDTSHPKGRRIYLFVLNAKATQGRGNGTMRTLDLSGFTDNSIRLIERMSETGAEWHRQEVYTARLLQASKSLYRACRAIWPRRTRHYALYSGRHQFKLNMEACLMSSEEIAALMGHSVTETHTQHYGVRSKGWSIDKILDQPLAVPEEVATVRQTLDHFLQRQKLVRVAEGRTAELENEDDFDDFAPELENESRYNPDGL